MDTSINNRKKMQPKEAMIPLLQMTTVTMALMTLEMIPETIPAQMVPMTPETMSEAIMGMLMGTTLGMLMGMTPETAMGTTLEMPMGTTLEMPMGTTLETLTGTTPETAMGMTPETTMVQTAMTTPRASRQRKRSCSRSGAMRQLEMSATTPSGDTRDAGAKPYARKLPASPTVIIVMPAHQIGERKYDFSLTPSSMSSSSSSSSSSSWLKSDSTASSSSLYRPKTSTNAIQAKLRKAGKKEQDTPQQPSSSPCP